MDDTTETGSFTSFLSPWRNLAWSFRKSRESWKTKYLELKRAQKRLQNQLRDVRKSREHWRQQAEQGPPPSHSPSTDADESLLPTVPPPAGEKKG